MKDIKADPEEICKVRKAPVPAPKTELRSFTGLIFYWRRFIKEFARKAAHLHSTAGAERTFKWTTLMEQDVTQMKK